MKLGQVISACFRLLFAQVLGDLHLKARRMWRRVSGN